MKKLFKILLSTLCAALIAAPAVFAVACDGASSGDNKGPQDTTPIEVVDYVSQLKLDMKSNTKKQEVTVRIFVDGDTTHFDPVTNSKLTTYNPDDFAGTQNFIKARYLAINTPESTGKIEEWGKKASKFTHSKLETAESIIVESDDNKWNLDSTGGRYLLWIWYIPQGGTEYINLNVQILQEGLAIASSTANNRYGTIANAALQQAKALKLYVHSGEPDPDFFYGDAIPMSMKELRCHLEKYSDMKVAVEGVVTACYSDSVYVESYDEEEEMYFGISVYYGASASGDVLSVLSIGNLVKVVGTVSYYEAGGTYQISGVKCNLFKPDINDCQLLDTGCDAAYVEIDVNKINENVSFDFVIEGETEEDAEVETVTLKYGEAIQSTSVSVANLKVKKIHTTSTGGSSDGAMTITCETADGKAITVRTGILKDASNKTITQDAYENKTISVKGVFAKFDGSYQIFVYLPSQITIVA